MPRVMVIEDSPTQAQQLAFVLEDAGFEVEIAPDAESGLERLTLAPFDVVLSDLHLPGDSGFDLCRRLKAHPRLRRLPIVVCTSEAEPINVMRGLEAGADAFINKQRDPEEIVGCLGRVLARPWSDEPTDRQHIRFLDHEFELTAKREQLLDILVSAFEDVVHLNKRAQETASALRTANRQLEDRNVELQRLANSERRALEELKKAETQLVQAEKLSALGQMVAGVAHEINNPLAFVANNIAVLKRDIEQLQIVLRLYQQGDRTIGDHLPELLERLRDQAEEFDLPYVSENLPHLLDRTNEGVRRIQKIVLNLRDFARLDESALKEVDLNEGIASTIQLLKGQAEEKQVVLSTDLASLPRLTCYPVKINLVVLNLVINAIDACPPRGQVTVSSIRTDDGIEIHVADTGCGIPPEVVSKIFDPFFTTKPQGKGTGLGLSISYGIVQSHGGTIEVESKVAHGTRFVIRLPTTPVPDNPTAATLAHPDIHTADREQSL